MSRIAVINPTYSGELKSTDELMQRYYHPFELSRALSRYIDRCTWIQGYSQDTRLSKEDVDVYFIRSRPFEGGMDDLMSVHIEPDAIKQIADIIIPDHVHILGLLPSDIIEIVNATRHITNSFSASFHGGHPGKNTEHIELQKEAIGYLSFVLFNSDERSKTWLDAGLIQSRDKVRICPETSSYFSKKNREQSRRKTDMRGDPVCVVSSRLHPIKDPMTILKGFEAFLGKRDKARLYWVYQTEELLAEVSTYIQSSDKLTTSVSLLGAKNYDEMEDFYNSADFFLQSSSQEYGGNSLVEAMACGVIPIVTDIPSFRYLSGNNKFGTLFDVGDYFGLANILHNIDRDKYESLSASVRRYFEEHLSFDIIAKTISTGYQTNAF